MPKRERSIIDKIIYSNWFAWPIIALAGFSVGLLHLKGRTTEALVGGAVLVIAAVLIFFGKRSE
jgi:lipopolysaccharide export LptBFGC system permease protein LptF